MKGLADILYKVQTEEKNITDAYTEICILFNDDIKVQKESEKFREEILMDFIRWYDLMDRDCHKRIINDYLKKQ